MDKETLRRFEEKYMPEPNSGCWLWMAGQHNYGYGAFWHNGIMYRAHVFSFEYYNGPVPEGFIVRHICDVTCCVNPEHLIIGTYKDNSRDMVLRGRNISRPPKGSNHPLSKLLESDLPIIRSRLKQGERHQLIANEYNVSRSLITRIANDQVWKHVKGDKEV